MIRQINTTLLKLPKRAEKNEVRYLVESFVDAGNLFGVISNTDNQVIFGRRGTGKTHFLNYLVRDTLEKGSLAIFLDLRLLGSTGGIYADPSITKTERANRLLADTLCAIHDNIRDVILENPERFDLSLAAPLLSEFIDASTQIEIRGQVEVQKTIASTLTDTKGVKASLKSDLKGPTASIESNRGSKEEHQDKTDVKRQGSQHVHINFGNVGRKFNDLVKSLPNSQVLIAIDEWSEIPLDLQPYLADLLRRTIFPSSGAIIKIAAIEHRCNFRVLEPSAGSIGIELGADISTSLHLDEYLVFDNNTEYAKDFFKNLLYKHVRALGEPAIGMVSMNSPDTFIKDVFFDDSAFEEFVISAEGVPRDALHIIGLAAQKALSNKISLENIRESARKLHFTAKFQDLNARPEARKFLFWLIDEILTGRKSKAFALEIGTDNEFINYLYDARLIHLIRQGVSSKDQLGRRYSIYALDYGCYVEQLDTPEGPEGLFQAELTNGTPMFINNLRSDYFSIKDAIIDPSSYYS